jgi:hypothetical protein
MLKINISGTAFLFCFVLVFVVTSFSSNAKRNSSENFQPVYLPDSLEQLSNLMQHGKNDSVRIAANTVFQKKLLDILQQSAAFDFDSVKNVSTLTAPDKSFRILTWTLPSWEGAYSFFGFIQTFNKKTGESKITALVDSTYRIEQPEMEKLHAGRWYGAVYYKILVNKKDGKNFYTLLGWKGKNPLATQKVIDVLHFSGDQTLFGFPLFKTDHVYRKRLIFEYASQAVMSLRYEEKKKMIVFDHLSGSTKDKKNETTDAASGPDGSYDALKFTGGKWTLLRDIDIRTDWKPKTQPKEPQVHEAPVEIIK